MSELLTCDCGAEFFPAYPGQEQCSTACRKAATKKPPKRTGRPAGFKDPQPTCRFPWCIKAAIHQHHVVYRQHVEDYGGDISDSRDAWGACEIHHMHHHNGKRRIRLSELRPENIEFAYELMGPAAEDYFNRYYDTTP